MSKKKKKQNSNSNKSRQSSAITKKSVESTTAQAQELQMSKNVANLPDDTSVKVENTKQNGDYTPQQVDEIVNELAVTPKRQRIWEIDFVRGLMILFVVWDHFMWDINSINYKTPYNTALFQWLFELSKTYYKGVLREVTHDVFVSMFVLTSGISCSFSRHNGKRALRMVIFALLFTAVTYAISAIIQSNVTIYFNVIHVIALSVLIYSGIEWIWAHCTKNWQKNIFGCVMFAVTLTALVVGSCAKAKPWTNESPIWFFLADHSGKEVAAYKIFMGGDYLSFFPDFGWFLVGAFLGKIMYREKKSIFPSVNAKYVEPITFCGRHSLWVYFISQIVMFGFVYLLHDMYRIL